MPVLWLEHERHVERASRQTQRAPVLGFSLAMECPQPHGHQGPFQVLHSAKAQVHPHYPELQETYYVSVWAGLILPQWASTREDRAQVARDSSVVNTAASTLWKIALLRLTHPQFLVHDKGIAPNPSTSRCHTQLRIQWPTVQGLMNLTQSEPMSYIHSGRSCSIAKCPHNGSRWQGSNPHSSTYCMCGLGTLFTYSLSKSIYL